MNPSIDNIMQKAHELIGNLLVAERLGSNTGADVFTQIHEEAERINELAKSISPSIFMPEPQEEVPASDQDDDLQTSESRFSDLSYDPDDEYQHEHGEEPKEILKCDYVEPSKHQDDAVEAKEEETAIASSTPNGDNIDETEGENYDLEDEPSEDNVNEEPAAHPSEQNAPADATNDYEEDYNLEDEPVDEQPLTVDAALQRNLSKDLRKAFSINDRFRYCRELFGNNNADMNDALDLVEAMKSYEEAEEYFYDDLQWDKESDEVAEFMTIIKNHFLP